jgi:hypothetical protein
MSTIRNNLLLFASVGLLAVGGCATTGGTLSSSAERLERNAYALQDEVRDDDARELAEEARDFRRVVEDRSSSDDDVRDAFNDLSRRYHAMRDEVDRSDDAEDEFQPVTEAYLDVERAMRSRGERDRYASDDY